MRAIARFANGDARSALNLLEFCGGVGADGSGRRASRQLDLPQLEQSIQRRALLYDKSGEEHYNLISALHKSMRNSDPDAAVYWVARMLEAGEDPLYIARRLVRFASEDIGNADPQALVVAVAAKDAAHFIGMPEGQHRARAGGDLPGHRAKEQRGLHRLQRRRGRRASRSRRAGAAAPAECADEADEGAGLRQGLPVRARGAGRGRRRWTACRRRSPAGKYYKPTDRGFEKEIKRRLDGWEKMKDERQTEEPKRQAPNSKFSSNLRLVESWQLQLESYSVEPTTFVDRDRERRNLPEHLGRAPAG